MSAQATSGFLSTQLGRGTTGYRAPELLREERKFNRKVDIWSFGCVIYELFTGKQAFKFDVAIFELNRVPPPISLPSIPGFRETMISDLVRNTLNWDPEARPNA